MPKPVGILMITPSLHKNSIHKNSIQKQSGVALITVMLVVAFAVIIATQMNKEIIFQSKRLENLQSNQQAYWYAMGAESFAKIVLRQSFKETEDQSKTTLDQMWASGETSFPVDLGEISGEITDMQACFNLNSLINVAKGSDDDSDNDDGTGNNNTGNDNTESNNSNNGNEIKNPAKQSLIELITLLEIDGVSNFEAESMADSLYDWLDDNSVISGSGGAEDNDYAAKEHPYLAANGLLASVNELRLIEHFTPQVIYALKEHVCVLPNNSLHNININTLDQEKPELLQALLGGVDTSKAEDIFAERGEEGFENIDDFLALDAVKDIENFKQYSQQFVVDSSYFLLEAKTSFNDSYFRMNSIMKINTDQSITVIDRHIGAD